MKVLGVLSQKGGVGKTTIATCLAVAAEKAGKKVLVIDLDPQATACFWSDIRKETNHSDRPQVEETVGARLSARLKSHEASGIDLVIIDGAAVAKDVTTQAVVVSDFILVPTKAGSFDLASMTHTIEVIHQQSKRGSVILTFTAPQGREMADAKAVVESLQMSLCPVTLANRKAYFRAQADGLAVQEYEPTGAAATEINNLYDYITVQLED